MFRFIGALVLFCAAFEGNAWNAMGHQLVAQIAYDNLTPEAKSKCIQYTKAYNKRSNFVSASTWLDSIRAKDIHWYDTLHYIDIPFTSDDTPLPAVDKINALWGIKQSLSVLASTKASTADKGLSLRILTHLVGDIHQPLHTVTKVHHNLPKGDLGGNLFPLAKNSIGDNLHRYWDNGGGALKGRSKAARVQNRARQLEKKWSCREALRVTSPKQWVDESHQLALTEVYAITPNTKPSKKYQLNTQNISQKQIVHAGCRLAALLNANQ